MVWTIVGGTATLLSYAILKPIVSIEPYASQNSREPFAEQFYLQNDSIYNIHAVSPQCGIAYVRNEFYRIGDSVIQNLADTVDTLTPGAKTTFTCDLTYAFGPRRDAEKYMNLDITILVNYKIPMGITKCQASNFSGKRVSDGSYIWTYHGSANCQDTLKNDAHRPW